MKVKFFTLMIVCSALTGCQHNNESQQSNFQSIPMPEQIAINEPSLPEEPQAPEIENTPLNIDKPKKIKQAKLETKDVATTHPAEPTVTSKPTPEKVTPQNIPVASLWQPNEALIARGAELILGLKNEIKREPTQHEVEKRLQTHMGLSTVQVAKVIAAVSQAHSQN